jgi:deoxyribose-phosphate aldolase
MNKLYVEDLIKKFSSKVDEKDMKETIEKAKSEAQNYNNKETFRRIYNFIDLTSLNTTDNREVIKNLCEKVNDFYKNNPTLDNVAGVCVYPNFIETVKENLEDDRVKKVVVSGVFPSAQSFFSVKLAEVNLSAEKGADEIDIVISVGEVIAGNYDIVYKELLLMKHAAGKSHLKVILETGAYKNYEDIRIASLLAMEAGADFIKTSTGKINVSATPEAAYIMLKAIKDYYEVSGRRVGFKPAGGISTPEDALLYYTLVKLILGEDWLTPEYFRIGASRLAGKIEDIIL